ncbi:MAG: elongation factor EF-2, partial [Candidatus Bathyarchaeota archaeon]|nr:elongation factor EF-2 [Candidatus Bathyarchaeota archaeon]
KLSIEDPTLVTKIDEETGEYLLSGMGQLHLEIATTWIKKTGIEIITSEPTVIYRESIKSSGGPYESKSPNKHNKVFIVVEALKPEVLELVKKGVVSEGSDRKKMASILRDHGWETKEARGVWAMDPHGNIFTNISKGVQRLDQVKGSITIGFVDAMDEGPLAGEPVRGVKVKLMDASIHEDPVHFGPAQLIPATRHGIFAAMLSADPILLEPLLKINVKTPMEEVGSVTSIVSQKRGKILSVEQRDRLAYITGELPASETFDISDVMRSATGGKAFWGTEFSRWETVSPSMKTQLIQELRRKKGLSPSPPTIKELLKP